MKTICAKTNPAFKRTQLLPVILNLLPPTTGGAARHVREITPETANDRPLRVFPPLLSKGWLTNDDNLSTLHSHTTDAEG